MKKWLGLLIVLAIVAAVPVRGEEPSGEVKKEAKAEKPRKLRLVKPWADLTTLTDE